ncbi:MAG: sodium:solute symporter family protein [Kiritimatiellae bacterium]|nr:sodium:solute symporter family protein [Kiritimatiellia bacterium]
MKIALLAAYFIVLLWIGFKCRKGAGSVNGFVLGGRSVGAWLTAFAYGTSYFSAVVFVGYAGQFGWRYGISATWAGIGNAVIGSLLAWVVLGRRTRLLSQHLDSATMPEFFGKRFDSKALKLVASAIIFVFLVPYTASLYNGLSRLFAMAFSMDYSVCIVLMSVLTAIYVIAGGYLATAVNDFIQGIIMLFGLVAIIAAVLMSKGGFVAALDGLARVTDPAVSTTPGIFASFFGPDPLNLLFVVILTSLGTWGLPQMVQKFYAIRNEDAIRKGTVISTLFAFVVAGGCYFLGGFGRLFGDKVDIAKDGFDAIIPAMLSNLGPGLIALTVILVLSASMSTLSSLVIASSSTLTSDFIKSAFVPNMKQKNEVLIIRLFIVVFIAISAVLAIMQHKSSVTFIAQLMGISWGALAGSFLAPFLYSLYWKGTTKAACWASFAFGSGLMIYNMLFRATLPAILRSPINSGAIAMLAGFVIVPVVSWLSKAPDRRFTDALFACYERPRQVTAKTDLGE